MHKAYRLQIREDYFDAKYNNFGRHVSSTAGNELHQPLAAFIMKDGNIDGGKLSDSWFPKVPAHVFISHSHADTELAYGLAGWLSVKFGISCFIDSSVWGYYPQLLEMICKEHAVLPSLWEGYKEQLAPHVHLMLATSLSMMMDKTECIIFIHSENSVIENNHQTRTKSPWLLHEVQMMRLLRQRSLTEHRRTPLEESFGSEKRAHGPQIYHPIDLSRLPVITKDDMFRWLVFASKLFLHGSESLDWLYENVTEPR